MSERVHIVGKGLAGSEAAYQLAEAGFSVVLHDMRPERMTEAHQSGLCAELVCSNSLKSTSTQSAPGILKSEMRQLGSLILKAADESAVPGGQALAVDRQLFAEAVTRAIAVHPLIECRNGEIHEPFKNEITLFATGPLTSDRLSQWLSRQSGEAELYFYDAIAPIVEADSIDRAEVFLANRYEKGEEAAYLNCPLNEDEYQRFVHALRTVELVKPREFEKERFFNGCQPIEAIARSGEESLRFGPMRPVGLVDPRNGKRPHAVLQLRPENQSLTAYNLVGCQTRMKYGDQAKVFGIIPALKNARYFRMGSIHRNTYVCGPKVLRADLSLKGHPKVYLAGQITGVEGYLESAACGMLAARFITQRLKRLPHLGPPPASALASLLRHVLGSNTQGQNKDYQPSGIHFGLFDPFFFATSSEDFKDKGLQREKMAQECLENIQQWQQRPQENSLSKNRSTGQSHDQSKNLLQSSP